MEEVKNTIEQVADTTATVLIRGESGTGKEVVARMIYAQSSREDKPFVKVNCAAIPYELLESELFGYEPGAFTGANRQKLGKFDLANSGSLFLDEISEMHPALQAKLLHVLQDGEFSRLGGKRDISVDVRVLAATNKPLENAVQDGTFREDLFYRLNVITIHIPPLRERGRRSRFFWISSCASTASSTVSSRLNLPNTPSPVCRNTAGQATFASWKTWLSAT